MKKKEPMDSKKEAQEESGNYNGSPIYLTLAGNGWRENALYLTTAIYQAQQAHAPLYVTAQVGGPGSPPNCPPGFPNCGNP